MPKQIQDEGRRWYAIHVYSGYEENVADSLRQRIESMRMSDKIFDVLVPTEKRIKIRNGKRKIVVEKIFPGYVIVDMVVTDDSWYVVRNTPNVTGFIGSGTTPIPLDEQEIKNIKKRMGVEEPKYKIDIKIDEPVKVIDGPFKGFEGKVSSIDEGRGRVKILISVFGRETPAELDFLQIKKL
jgi:transcriptional antiterminator NusG